MPSPLAPPLSTDWRRERLLRIGSTSNGTNNAPPETDEPESFFPDNTRPSSPTEQTRLTLSRTSYSTLGPPRNRLPHDPSTHQHLTALRRTLSNPRSLAPPTLRARALSRLTNERPISAYDLPLNTSKGEVTSDPDAQINGIRVWYSSFTSIDWLHDAIKDSVRFARLRRRRRSFRARVRLLVDKSLGWLVVTVVGFLTAIVAFLVVRSEQWLFDSKEGYCHSAWWKAKHFCCAETSNIMGPPRAGRGECPEWRKWATVLAGDGKGLGVDVVEYGSYILIAVCLLPLPVVAFH